MSAKRYRLSPKSRKINHDDAKVNHITSSPHRFLLAELLAATGLHNQRVSRGQKIFQLLRNATMRKLLSCCYVAIVIFSFSRCGVVEGSVSSTSAAASVAASVIAEKSEKKTKEKKKRLTMDTLALGVKNMQYAVRGPVVQAADALADDLKKGEKGYAFDRILYTNIGNPQSVGQKPLTWPRQVLALVDLPDEVGVDHPVVSQMFPADAIRRAREIKRGLVHGSGAYSHSKGAHCFRVDVANFIQQRDGGDVPSDPENIFLTNGASAGISMILQCLIAKPTTGVMIPIPQYPIYSAEIDLLDGQAVGYYLDETKDWELNMQELDRAYQDALSRGVDIAAMVLINPGNPTGQVLTPANVRDVVQFCADRSLVLLADEVYQENVYEPGSVFCSAKKAAHECGLLENDRIELVSFHSVSKGVFGECGRRGGYMELVGIDTDVKDMIYKLASSFLCSTVSGQVMTSLMVRGPQQGDESYENHEKEKAEVFESLRRRAKIVSRGLDAIPGFSCRPAQGSMYCFPRIVMPPGALEEAERRGTDPDTFYAVSLLHRTGICVVPASGFGQEEGRFGFRTTFLPPESDMALAVEKIATHYREFCDQFGGGGGGGSQKP
jgi:aspartate/methionine/tyrosine aminotransferase